jgi:hypothetical protein
MAPAAEPGVVPVPGLPNKVYRELQLRELFYGHLYFGSAIAGFGVMFNNIHLGK